MVGDLTVLQPARPYPVGSFTLIHAQGLLCNGDPRRCNWGGTAPFYLVHAPGRAPFLECSGRARRGGDAYRPPGSMRSVGDQKAGSAATARGAIFGLTA